MANKKSYIGDGVYAEYDQDDERILLTIEDGYTIRDKIWLEASVMESLIMFVKNNTAWRLP